MQGASIQSSYPSSDSIMPCRSADPQQGHFDRLAKVGVWPRYRPSAALDRDLREDNDYFGGIIRRYKIGGQ
jgi:hypothetical protein